MEYRFTELQIQANRIHVLRSGFNKLKSVLDQWNQNLVTRRQLRELDDNQLRDIGIDRVTAQRESNKPFWKG